MIEKNESELVMRTLPEVKAYNGNGNYIFLSYSHKDKDVVFPFIAALQKEHNVWFDDGIHYGNEWEDEIAARVENCSIFIYIVSKESLESNNCKDELALARDLGKNFINILTYENPDFPRWYKLRYKRYQMCNYFSFTSPEAAVEDLQRKSEWFDIVKTDINVDVESEHGPEATDVGQDPAENNINVAVETGSEKWTANSMPENADIAAEKAEIKRDLVDALNAVSESNTEGAENNAVPREENEKTMAGAQLQKGDIIEFGRYIQHKGGAPEPIKWRVLKLEEGKALLVSEYALDCMPYNATFGEAVWENSLIRKWIKTTFLQTAFNEEESNRILNSEIKTSTKGQICENTTDKIFLLSFDAILKYFKGAAAQKCAATPYCYEKGAIRAKEGNCCWWIRSRSTLDASFVSYIDSEGIVHKIIGGRTDHKGFTVRPAMWIKLDP